MLIAFYHLSTAMTSSASFYVILPSNTLTEEGNHTNSFRIRLPRKLEFNSDWCVGLAVIVYPHSWPSLGTNERQHVRVVWQTGDSMEIEIAPSSFCNPLELLRSLNESLRQGRDDLVKLLKSLTEQLNLIRDKAQRSVDSQKPLDSAPLYENVSQLESNNNDPKEDDEIGSVHSDVDSSGKPGLGADSQHENPRFLHYFNKYLQMHLNSQLMDMYNRTLDHGGPDIWINAFKEARYACKFQYTQDKQRFALSINDLIIKRVELSAQLAYIMGFQSTCLETSQTSHFFPDMTGGVSSFYVYAPGLIEPVIIGDITAPVLRVVNIRGHSDELIEECYVAIQYHKLLVKEISEIFVEIRSASGTLMPFQYGSCTLTLHFRKMPYF